MPYFSNGGSSGTDTDNAIYFFDAEASMSFGITRFISWGRGSTNGFDTSDLSALPIVRAGTLRNFYVYVNTSNLNGTLDITVMNNTIATAITVQYAASGTGIKSDAVNTASVVAGDRLSLKIVSAGTAGSASRISGALEI